MTNLLIRYLKLRKLRKEIERPKGKSVLRMAWPHPFHPDILQTSNVLSLEKMYILAWATVNNRDFITFNELINLPFLKNLHNTESFKEIKSCMFSKDGTRKNEKSICIDELIFGITNTHRIAKPFKTEKNTPARERFFYEAKKMAARSISIFKSYPEKGWFKYRFIYALEQNHRDALRVEHDMFNDFEILAQNFDNKNWPQPSTDQVFTTGWVMFSIGINMTVNILEIQCPIEDRAPFMRIIEPPAWTGYVLQHFLQYFILRGFTRFTMPTLKGRKHMIDEHVKTLESNYREIPKKFNFVRVGEDDVWTLDLSDKVLQQ